MLFPVTRPWAVSGSAILLAWTVASTAAAQGGPPPDTTKSARLPTLTVSSERPRTLPPPVTTVVVAPGRLRAEQAANPYDLMRKATGVEVHEQGQGPGFASDVVLRGFSSDHSSDVLLVIDGVPINLPVHGHVEGYADWSILSPAAVQSFRVITGTASPLYGDFAMGGVVEVFTSPDATGVSSGVSGTSSGDSGGWLRTGHRGTSGGSALAFNGRRQQGWRDHSDYWLGNGLLRGWHTLGSGQVEGGLAYYRSSWNSPGFLSVAQYNAGELSQAIDPTDGGSAERLIAHGRVTAHPAGLALDASGWVQHVRSSVFLNIPEDGVQEQNEEQDRRWAVGGHAQLGRKLALGDLSLGVDGRADMAHYDLYLTDARERVEPSRQYDGDYQSGGVFVRLRELIGSSLIVDAGLRADLLHYHTRDRLADTPWADHTESILAPKLGVRWFAAPTWSVLASLSRGFRGAPGVIADPTVPTVTAWTKEVGLRYAAESGKLNLSLAAFRLDVANERIQDPVTREISSAGGSVRQGVTGDLSWAPAPRFRFIAEGTINDATISGGPAAEAVLTARRARAATEPEVLRPLLHIEPLEPGDPVPNVARYTGRFGVEAGVSRQVVTRVDLRLAGAYTPIGEREVRTRPYQLVAIGVSVRLPGTGALLDLDLDNLFNARTPEIRASGFINPGAPRMLRAAIRFADHP